MAKFLFVDLRLNIPKISPIKATNGTTPPTIKVIKGANGISISGGDGIKRTIINIIIKPPLIIPNTNEAIALPFGSGLGC
jgi:hypothetical protein